MFWRALWLAVVIATLHHVWTQQLRRTVDPPWFVTGNHSRDYDAYVDTLLDPRHFHAFTIRNKPQLQRDSFGTIMQSVAAQPYLRRRIRFSAMIKRENVKVHAALWLRCDDRNNTPMDFVNSEQRYSTQHDSEWREEQLELNIPADAAYVAFGVVLAGEGQVWMDEWHLQMLDDNPSDTTP